MFLFVGLPSESNLNISEELKIIEQENRMSIIQINIPVFTNLYISQSSAHDDKLQKIEKECIDLISMFSSVYKECDYSNSNIYNSSNTSNISSSYTNFKLKFTKQNLEWDTSKYNTLDIEECINMVTYDLSILKKLFYAKKDQHIKLKEEFDKLIRRTKGNLMERDLNYTKSQYEFLDEVFVVVNKNEIGRFIELVKSILSEDTVEKIDEDKMFCLFRVVMLKNCLDKFVKECEIMNFHIKKCVEDEKNDGKDDIIEIDDSINISNCNINGNIDTCSRNTNNSNINDSNLDKSNTTSTINNSNTSSYISSKETLILFVETHFKELYKILVHIKLMKIFIEAFCRYGLPKEYVFFATTGKNLFNKIKKISDNWKSDRIIEESDDGQLNDDQQQQNSCCYAYSCIEFREDLNK